MHRNERGGSFGMESLKKLAYRMIIVIIEAGILLFLLRLQERGTISTTMAIVISEHVGFFVYPVIRKTT